MITEDSLYIRRCLELAGLGAGYTAPNPMVGAILVHEGQIIGEGFHQKFGEAHAEVNCIDDAMAKGYADLLRSSTLFVSLEPCAHHGKTPPCADLIIKKQIPRVVIGCRDPFKEVNGKGIEKLLKAGIEVKSGILEEECVEMNKRFFTFHLQRRPYVILKWARSKDGFISHPVDSRIKISNEFSDRLVHRWRAEEAAILVGTNTALMDDPQLTTRLWPGPSPLRLVIDMDLRLPSTLRLFDGQGQTIIFNAYKHEENGNPGFWQVTKDVSLVQQVLHALYHLNVLSILVEGGSRLLQAFIDDGSWDEARVIQNKKLILDKGLPAPELNGSTRFAEAKLGEDLIEYFHPMKH